MDAVELRISEIMVEQECSADVAEWIFFDEIEEKYGTDNGDVAEAMFLADADCV